MPLVVICGKLRKRAALCFTAHIYYLLHVDEIFVLTRIDGAY